MILKVCSNGNRVTTDLSTGHSRGHATETDSEIGRAGNATLGVSDLSATRVAMSRLMACIHPVRKNTGHWAKRKIRSKGCHGFAKFAHRL